MPVFFNFGFIQNNSITSSGSIGIGQNIIQNRNGTKNNNASTNVGVGLNNVPVLFHQNVDPDNIDQANIDAQNLGGPQL
ncbi:hypothetical protein MK805_17175 [Shimazuella sp. AN120528]|uniref:hypothetical protein n=1 Tax=Shimazuella soli TaxID=1892854 RepID=UPI001F0E3C49|nr:hypothetical protein [Shimazuella soli]MCH5586670.1 hypothetical protein [Shimazuella soli]